jgi:hypothetical protein
MRYFDDDSPRPPSGDAGDEARQDWACGPTGFWLLLGSAPVEVSWEYSAALISRYWR